MAGGGNGIDTESDMEESKKYGVVSRKVMPQRYKIDETLGRNNYGIFWCESIKENTIIHI